jgi:hypothetical protein
VTKNEIERRKRQDRALRIINGEKPPKRAACGVYIDGWLRDLPAVASADFAPFIEWQTLCTHLMQNDNDSEARHVFPYIEPLAAGFYFVAMEQGRKDVARELRSILRKTSAEMTNGLERTLSMGKRQCAIWAVIQVAEREALRRGVTLGDELDLVQGAIDY